MLEQSSRRKQLIIALLSVVIFGLILLVRSGIFLSSLSVLCGIDSLCFKVWFATMNFPYATADDNTPAGNGDSGDQNGYSRANSTVWVISDNPSDNSTNVNGDPNSSNPDGSMPSNWSPSSESDNNGSGWGVAPSNDGSQNAGLYTDSSALSSAAADPNLSSSPASPPWSSPSDDGSSPASLVALTTITIGSEWTVTASGYATDTTSLASLVASLQSMDSSMSDGIHTMITSNGVFMESPAPTSTTGGTGWWDATTFISSTTVPSGASSTSSVSGISSLSTSFQSKVVAEAPLFDSATVVPGGSVWKKREVARWD